MAWQRASGCCPRRLAFVDVRHCAGAEFRRTRECLSADSFHPSSYGYRLIADSLFPVLLSCSAAAP